jgi:hypothetical protein
MEYPEQRGFPKNPTVKNRSNPIVAKLLPGTPPSDDLGWLAAARGV